METVGSGIQSSKRLHVRDRDSGLVFLIDTGSDNSLLPADKKTINNLPNDVILFAANESCVLTYGTTRLSLNLNLRRKFSWNFCVAAVPNPIIGADLLAHYHLVPYFQESRLVDTTTGLGVVGFIKSAAVFSVSSVDRSEAYSEILSEFPEITGISQISKIKVCVFNIISSPRDLQCSKEPDVCPLTNCWLLNRCFGRFWTTVFVDHPAALGLLLFI